MARAAAAKRRQTVSERAGAANRSARLVFAVPHRAAIAPARVFGTFVVVVSLMRMPRVPRPCRSALRLAWSACVLVVAVGAVRAQGLPDRLRYEVPEPAAQARSAGATLAVLQDRTGYLWVASENGLYRYDGYQFEAFFADPSDPAALPVQRLLALAEGPDGSLWILADRFGLVRFDMATERFERFPTPELVTFSGRLAVGGDGTPFVLTSSGLWRLDPATGETHQVQVEGKPVDLSTDRDGRVWVTGKWGTVAIDPATDRRDFVGVPAGAVARATAAGAWAVGGGRWWVQAADGAFRAVGETPPLLPSAWAVDRRGVLWMADGVGLTACAPSGCVSYPGGVLDPRVQAIYEDRGGVLWLASIGGLFKLVPRWEAFTSFDLPETDLSVALGATAAGDVVAASICGSPFRLDMDEGTFRPLVESMPAAAGAPRCMASINTTPDGALWMPAWTNNAFGGAVRIGDGEARRVLPFAEEEQTLRENALRVVFEDAAGRMWGGGEGGLFEFDPKAESPRPLRSFGKAAGGLQADVIWHLADASGPGGEPGWLWVATYGGGLCRLDPGTGRAACYRHDADDPASIPSDQVSLVVPVPVDSTVWVGTYDAGLARLDLRTGRFRRIGVRDGLPHPFVRSLVPDGSGRVWIGTYAGLVRLAVGEAGEAPTLDVFTQADGLPSIAFGLYDGLALPDGRFTFGTDRHVVIFHPDSVRAAPFEPPLVLSRFDVLGERRAVGPRPEEIRLRYEENLLRFGFTALDFAAPGQTRYAYRMDGFDPPEHEGGGWTDATERAATYTNLAPGRYAFRVRARTGSGTWSPQELAVPLVVVPPFWMTSWFRTGTFVLFMLAIGAGGSALARRRYRERMRELQAERRVQAERVRISRDLHDHVGAQLAGLLGDIDLVRLASRRAARAGEPAAVGEHLDRLEADARTTMGQLRETIWALHRETLTLGEFADRLRRFAESQAGLYAGAPEVAVRLDGDPAGTLRPMVALHLYRIGQEAVRNAIRHAGARHVEAVVRHQGGHVVLTVADDGAFREPSGDGAGDDLSGFGLQTMRARAEEMGATLELRTDGGTTVEVGVSDV